MRLGATHLVDAATLTGAVSVALGSVNIGLLSNDDSLSDYFKATGRTIGEHFWPLPMNDEYPLAKEGRLVRFAKCRQRPQGRYDHGGQVPRAIRGRHTLGTPRHRRHGQPRQGPAEAPKGASGIAVRKLVRAVENWPRKGAK
ncbi:MAG: hypothetical protein CM1200mP29_09740 [Verrucomicrobiota bacterium]|nr:MAG: hypothetical protein CM1200mP29_09740 [Verrucomicrobiota bacterium]